MKKLYTLALFLAINLSMMGRPVDETTALQLTKNFWNENNIMGVRNGKVYKGLTSEASFVNVAPQCGYSEFYIFSNSGGKGYVIVSADDCEMPILGYSFENSFEVSALPSNLKSWLDGYAEQIRIAVKSKAVATEEIKESWECLKQGKNLPIKSETAVSPLVQTKWDQSPYFNAQCPYDYNANQRTLTGCVATAMAQIMKYWSYPAHGYGSHSYVPSNHPEYGTLYADFSAVNYQWSSMPNTLSSNNNAVATLMYHCGVSVDMSYGISGSPDYGSAAYIIDNGNNRPCAETALKSYFDYSSSLHNVLKSNYSDSQWISLLKTELNNGRPLLYGGFSNSGGHAFVCDGFNNNDYFHFNWGWGGYCDGYFYINTLNPSSSNYSSNQQALVGIEPKQNGGGGGGGGSSSNFNLVYYKDLTMSETEYWFYEDFSVHAEILNSGDASFSGYIGAGVFRRNEAGEYRFLNIMDYWNRTSNPLSPNYYVHGDMECEAGPPYIPGSYGIAMLYSLDGDLWNFIDEGNYNDVFFDIVYASDIETYSNFNITSGDYLYYGTNSTVNVDVLNSGSSTFYGKFRVNLANADGSWAQNIAILNCSNGLGANYHYTNGLNFTGEISVEPGTYYMELAYQESGSSSWYYAGASQYQNPVVVEVVAPSVTFDRYEANNTVGGAYLLPCNITGSSTTVSTTGANFHDSNDIDYYKIQLNSGKNYTITPRLYDSYNSSSSVYYTVDAKFAYSTDGTNWSEFYDDVMPSSISVLGGGTLYFCVQPYFEGRTGTYLLNIGIIVGTGLDESDETHVSVYPNPVKEVLNVTGCGDAKEIRLFDALGIMVKRFNANENHIQLPMTDLPNGVYMLHFVNGERIYTRRIVKAE